MYLLLIIFMAKLCTNIGALPTSIISYKHIDAKNNLLLIQLLLNVAFLKNYLSFYYRNITLPINLAFRKPIDIDIVFARCGARE